MYPIVNPYRDKEYLASLDAKSKRCAPYCSSRVFLALILLVLTAGTYYLHHIHNAHLNPSVVNPSIRGSAQVSFSAGVKDYSIEVMAEEEKHKLRAIVDQKRKDVSQKEPQTVKISSFVPDQKVPEGRVATSDRSYSPELVNKLVAESVHANAVEDKVIALAALSRQKELKAAADRVERERMREEERLAAESARLKVEEDRIAAEEMAARIAKIQAAKLIEDQRAAQIAADEKATQLEAEKQAAAQEAVRKAAVHEAETLLAQQKAQKEADQLLALHAEEKRSAAKAREEAILKAAISAQQPPPPQHPQEPQHPEPPPEHAEDRLDGPIGILAPPEIDKKAEPAVAETLPEDRLEPVGILAPPAEPEPEPEPAVIVAPPPPPPVAGGDVSPVTDVDSPAIPAEILEKPVGEGAAQAAAAAEAEAEAAHAALAAEVNLGHPDVPVEADTEAQQPELLQQKDPPVAVPAVPVLSLLPPEPAVPSDIHDAPNPTTEEAVPDVPMVAQDGIESLAPPPPLLPVPEEMISDPVPVDSAAELPPPDDPIVALQPPAAVNPVGPDVPEARAVPVLELPPQANADPEITFPTDSMKLPTNPTESTDPAQQPLIPVSTTPDRPTGYDLPPEKVLKILAEARGPAPAKNPGEKKIDYCAGQVDPFADSPVDSFMPPEGADFELVAQWRSAVRAMVTKVSKVKFGGEELRELIRTEVETLQVLRFKMFCQYA